MGDTTQNLNKYLYRIYSFDFQDDGFIDNFVIQDMETRLTRKFKLEQLIADTTFLAQCRIQDVITIAYMAGQQEILKEQAWLNGIKQKI